MSDLENLYIKRNEAYKNNDIETVNNITEELNNLYPVKPKSVLCIDGIPVQFEILGVCEPAISVATLRKKENFKEYKSRQIMVNGNLCQKTYHRLLIKMR